MTIGLLKVSAPWQVFAYLGYGGWNDCPPPHAQCAMHRYWHERYGAEVASVAGDVVECIVSRPPEDRSTSMSLAREQYIYCYDIVDQGVGSISALGANLLGSSYWYFWWD